MELTTTEQSGRKPRSCATAAPKAPLDPPSLFRSFWIAGFESACHINKHGERLDMIAASQHDVRAAHDYALLPQVGIRTARDVVR